MAGEEATALVDSRLKTSPEGMGTDEVLFVCRNAVDDKGVANGNAEGFPASCARTALWEEDSSATETIFLSLVAG